MQLNLGGERIAHLAMQAGSRKPPSEPASPNSIEVICSPAVPKTWPLTSSSWSHGSKTSSRASFLDAVGAKTYVVSSGPHKYNGVILPDAEIIDELEQRGEVWRTDIDDDACAVSDRKIGEVEDDRPGGCTNVLIRFSPAGVQAAYRPLP